ncbi:MAG: C4-dicarboxylate ABC transporter permease, partial [Pseudothermotoga sp.]|nr:C4-dicarboxylate ABC transporter permease [Pseudothermotoga sp.]
ALPILAILVGIGMLIEVMTLTGVRGFIVANMLFFPYAVLFLSVGLGTPAFGAISSYGAASVLGIPFLLAFRGGNDVLIASSISLLAGLGDILPPTALASTLAAQVSGLGSYMEVLKRSLGFLLTTMVLCVTFIAYSIRFAKIFTNPWWFILVVGMIFLVATILDKTERKGK